MNGPSKFVIKLASVVLKHVLGVTFHLGFFGVFFEIEALDISSSQKKRLNEHGKTYKGICSRRVESDYNHHNRV